jgi:plastocyanin
MSRLSGAALPFRALTALTALALALAASGCGSGDTGSAGPTGTSDSGNTIFLTGDNFVQHSIHIAPGATLRFDDTGGVAHQICVGEDMRCEPNARAPQALQGAGFGIKPPEIKPVLFTNPGVYHLTCTIHPNMNLVVTVS